jgi:hypothetical protein
MLCIVKGKCFSGVVHANMYTRDFFFDVIECPPPGVGGLIRPPVRIDFTCVLPIVSPVDWPSRGHRNVRKGLRPLYLIECHKASCQACRPRRGR